MMKNSLFDIPYINYSLVVSLFNISSNHSRDLQTYSHFIKSWINLFQ